MKVRSKTLRLPSRKVNPAALGPFRWGKIGHNVVLTNDAGEWSILPSHEFDTFLRGEVDETHARFEELRDRGFLRSDLDLEELANSTSPRNYSTKLDGIVEDEEDPEKPSRPSISRKKSATRNRSQSSRSVRNSESFSAV